MPALSPQSEFTGERVVPGQVDPDLWNEHLARYLFASRLARRKRVLDVACGAGYGSAELAATAASVAAIDIAEGAVRQAAASYERGNLRFACASATALPFRDRAFDLITAFEVIEHLEDWDLLLSEAARLLAPGGQLIVSTPNKSYYAEARKLAGPNPFHAHEFEFEEFGAALERHFRHVSLFVQNHAAVVAFQPLAGTGGAEIRMDTAAVDPAESHFFMAVCAQSPQTGSPAYLYLPTAANVLRARELHIRRLEQELAQKEEWLAKSQADHQELLARHRAQQQELEDRNRWAAKLDEDLAAAGRRVSELQQELVEEAANATEVVAGYERKIAELEREGNERAAAVEAHWRGEFENKSRELVECVRLLDTAEKTVEERTLWAQSLDREKTAVEAQLSMVQASRWIKVGRRLGLGPRVGG
ncbi:MAG: methyltransferase domain-containing protein [Bryobacteraceae bacterium]